MWAAAISAGSNLIGGLMASRDARRAQDISREQAAANMQMQREFAQHGISWKVDDARNAGIHPLYALGAQTHSFSPVGINVPTGGQLGRGLAAAGQDISRALIAKTNREERREVDQIQKEILEAQRDHIRAQTGVLLGRMNPQIPPPLPSALGNNPLYPPDLDTFNRGVVIEPDRASAVRRDMPSVSAAAVAGSQIVRTGPNSWAFKPGPEMNIDELTSPNALGWFIQQQFNTQPMPWKILRDNYPDAIGWAYDLFSRNFVPHYPGDKHLPHVRIFYENSSWKAKPRPHPRRGWNIGGYGG